MKIITCRQNFRHRRTDFAQVFLRKLLCINLRCVEHWLFKIKPTSLQMPADQLRKLRYLREILNVQYWIKRMLSDLKCSNSEHCQGLHWWLESTWESRCGFLCRIPKQFPTTSIFSPWNTHHCVPGRSLSYSRSGKEPAFGKNAQSKYCWAGWYSGSYQSTHKLHRNINYSVQLH